MSFVSARRQERTAAVVVAKKCHQERNRVSTSGSGEEDKVIRRCRLGNTGDVAPLRGHGNIQGGHEVVLRVRRCVLTPRYEGMLEQVFGCGPPIRTLHQTAGEEVRQLWRHLTKTKQHVHNQYELLLKSRQSRKKKAYWARHNTWIILYHMVWLLSVNKRPLC